MTRKLHAALRQLLRTEVEKSAAKLAEELGETSCAGDGSDTPLAQMAPKRSFSGSGNIFAVLRHPKPKRGRLGGGLGHSERRRQHEHYKRLCTTAAAALATLVPRMLSLDPRRRPVHYTPLYVLAVHPVAPATIATLAMRGSVVADGAARRCRRQTTAP